MGTKGKDVFFQHKASCSHSDGEKNTEMDMAGVLNLVLFGRCTVSLVIQKHKPESFV
jgi:hypothetical protein